MYEEQFGFVLREGGGEEGARGTLFKAHGWRRREEKKQEEKETRAADGEYSVAICEREMLLLIKLSKRPSIASVRDTITIRTRQTKLGLNYIIIYSRIRVLSHSTIQSHEGYIHFSIPLQRKSKRWKFLPFPLLSFL